MGIDVTEACDEDVFVGVRNHMLTISYSSQKYGLKGLRDRVVLVRQFNGRLQDALVELGQCFAEEGLNRIVVSDFYKEGYAPLHEDCKELLKDVTHYLSLIRNPECSQQDS